MDILCKDRTEKDTKISDITISKQTNTCIPFYNVHYVYTQSKLKETYSVF